MIDNISFFNAVENGNVSIIEEICKNEPKLIHEINDKGLTALHVAAAQGNTEMITLLVKLGANIDATVSQTEDFLITNFTPLHFAASNRNVDAVKLLLDNKADPNKLDGLGYSPLTHAILDTDMTMCQILISSQAEIQPKDLNFAALRGGIVQFIDLTRNHLSLNDIRNLVNSNEFGQTPLDVIATNRDNQYSPDEQLEAAESIIFYGAKDNENQAILSAMRSQSIELAKFLMKGVNIKDCNYNFGFTPIILAAQMGNWDLFDFMLKYLGKSARNYGVDPKDYVQVLKTSFYVLAEAGELEAARKLKMYGLNINDLSNDENILIMAARKGDVKMVKFFIEEGIKLDTKDKSGMTALHIASVYGFPDVAEMLISHGASVDEYDFMGAKPIDYALSNKDEKMLVALGANVEEVKKSKEFGKPYVNQDLLNKKLGGYCLAKGWVKNGEKHPFLDERGNCNGWTFLRGYYSGIGHLQEFEDIRQFVANWDGQLDSLLGNDSMSELLKNKRYPNGKLMYPNGEKLLELLVNDLSIFQNTSEKFKTIVEAEQSDRKKLWDVVHDDKTQFSTLLFADNIDLPDNLNTIYDLLNLAAELPNTWIDISLIPTKTSEHGHSIGFDVESKGQLNYFDSNFNFEMNGRYSLDQIAIFMQNALRQNMSIRWFSIYQFFRDEKQDKKGEKASTATLLQAMFKSDTGRFLLYHLLKQKEVSEAKLILPKGMDLNLVDLNGNTAIHHVAKAGNLPLAIELIKEYKADVNAQMKDGKAVLHQVVEQGDVKAVEELIKNGAIIDLADIKGCTPLHLAVMKKDKIIVNKLLELGAKQHPNKAMQTPLDLAKSLGDKEIITLLSLPQSIKTSKPLIMSKPPDPKTSPTLPQNEPTTSIKPKSKF
ncbi:MAG: hypothetical protein BGO43_03330 [Gammaproteobacteria bacterium 39-13]|nr:ankyrin repeat domain-containing protein [Gammaproteobacteria bacterium]OJV92045.1 MAG: hypothetical protein BGO43_03330 [Gammaproteobacteria bacterium 39-13]